MQYVGSRGTITSVSVSSTTALAMAAGARKYGIVYNESGQTVYLAFADTATTTAGGYTVAILDSAYYEIPGVYQGAVSAITESGAGSISVTVID